MLWIAGVAAGLLLLYGLLIWAGTRAILRSYRRTPARVRREMGFSEPGELGLRSERLELEVEPGLVLRGFLFPTRAERRGLIVYHHGIWDACRPRLRTAVHLVARGFDVAFYDSRGHGESGGRYCTYGQREEVDLRRVLDHLESRAVDTSRVIVIGHSMGAATAVYAALRDARIVGLILESCYRDLPTAIRDYARLFVPFLPEFVIRASERRAARIGRFEPARLSPVEAVSGLRVPVLYVQGTADRKIKPRYATELCQATPEPRELYYIEGARHGRVWHEGGEAYLEKLSGWLDAWCAVPETRNP